MSEEGRRAWSALLRVAAGTLVVLLMGLLPEGVRNPVLAPVAFASFAWAAPWA